MIKELKKSEEGYRNLFESNLDGIIHVDMEGNFRDCNEAFLEMVGYSVEEIKKKTFQQLTPEKWRKADENAVNQIMTKGYYDEYEKEYIRKDGTLFPVNLKGWLVRDDKGEPMGMWAIIRDITDHKKAEAKDAQKTAIMNAINEIFKEALTCESAKELGQICLEVAQELSGAKFGFFGEVNKEGKFDTIAISNPGWDECKMPDSESTKIIKGMEIRGMQFLSLKDGKSRIFNDPSNHPDSVGTPKGHPKITCLLAVPFKYKGKIIGQIGLGNKEGGFNHYDQEAIEALSIAMIEALMRKRAEEAVQESELRFRGIFESKMIGVLFWDAGGDIIDANDAFLDMVGYTNEEVLKGVVHWKDMTPIEYAEQDNKALEEIAVTGVMTPIEKEYICKDGSRIPIILGAASLPGPTLRGVAFVVDNTERKRAQNEIRQAYFELDQIFNTALPMYVVDKNYNILKVNKTLTSLFQINKDELIGKKCYDALKSPLCNTPDCSLKQIFEGKDKFQYEGDKILKDGAKISYFKNVNSYRSVDGELLGAINSFTDITENVKTEDALREREHDLNERVKELRCLYNISKLAQQPDIYINALFDQTVMFIPPAMQFPEIACVRILYENRMFKTKNFSETIWCLKTPIKEYKKNVGYIEIYYLKEKPEFDEKPFQKEEIDLINAISEILGIFIEHKNSEIKLKGTLKELKRSNAELEQFAYVASHDLQEPLRMVASFTQLLQNRYQDKLDDDANDFINYAVDGATRMQNLISDLLIFSRVGTRGKPFKATDMNTVLEGVLATFRQTIKETNTTLTYNPLPVIIADESQMIQLLQNLISNAIKFRSEEPSRILVSGEVQADKWIFSVSDNGIGMDPKYFDRIFVIFQRLHKKNEYGGTGIGLAVCKKIIQRHGGKIWVESELGKGSTFTFSIPKRKVGKKE